MATPQRKFRTSGKPMKRRTAYKVYRAFMLYLDVTRVAKKLFNDDSPESVRKNTKAIAKSLGMTPQQMALQWNRFCRCGDDRFRRMTRKVDRDMNSKASPVSNWLKYGFAKCTREKREIDMIAWRLSQITEMLNVWMGDRSPWATVPDNTSVG